MAIDFVPKYLAELKVAKKKLFLQLNNIEFNFPVPEIINTKYYSKISSDILLLYLQLYICSPHLILHV
jgi:hypothetical protein